MNHCTDPLSTSQLPSVMEPPPVRNLWVITGVNLNTEVSYFYRGTASGAGDKAKSRLILDPKADKYRCFVGLGSFELC